MDAQFDYIEELMLASLSGKIAEQDQLFLDEMIAKDPCVAELWRQHVLIAGYLKNSHRKEAAWARIQKQIVPDPEKKPRKKVSLYFVGALGLLILVVSSIYFFNDAKKDSLKYVQSENRDHLTFSFDNTEVPIISAVTRTTVADIEIKDGQLNFHSKTANGSICTLRVPKKMDTKIILSDGTKIWINAASQLSFPLTFNTALREVALTGEAYFEVMRRKTQPFIVTAGRMKVEVKGTHFNVRAYPNEKIETSLSQGSVSVVAGKQMRLLIPDEMATFDQASGLQIGSFDSSKVLSWIKGIYRFNNQRLEEINTVFDRWFDYTFQYKDQSLKEIKFSGFLDKKQPLDSFLQRLCLSADLNYQYDRQQVTLSRK
jgi:transmembrane sensor